MLSDLIRRPVIVAPMAGGPSTTDLVVAAASAGAIGFVAAGYKSAAAMRADIESVRTATAQPFGVNVFVPGAPDADAAALGRYLDEIAPDAARVGANLGQAAWDDDDWDAKIAELLAHPVPIVSFTFGCPGAEVVSALRAAGTSVWVTVTDPAEAQIAAIAGVDALAVQGSEAGAHRGAFANDVGALPNETGVLELLAEVRAVTGLPLAAAGGIMDAAGVAAVRAAGAVAAQCGTAFLRCPESGANPTYRAALTDPRFTTTAVTRAFSGRPARGLVNQFMRDHAGAPAAYPEINNATRPMRAAAAVGYPDLLSLWAGTGFRAGTDRPAAEVLDMLCGPPIAEPSRSNLRDYDH
jgi:nitronate monooxygenase